MTSAHESRVAGVEVSPDHYIGGERVASDATFIDVSPIDGQPLAEIARGGTREADQRARGRRGAFPGLGGARARRARRATCAGSPT